MTAHLSETHIPPVDVRTVAERTAAAIAELDAVRDRLRAQHGEPGHGYTVEMGASTAAGLDLDALRAAGYTVTVIGTTGLLVDDPYAEPTDAQREAVRAWFERTRELRTCAEDRTYFARKPFSHSRRFQAACARRRRRVPRKS